MKHLLKIPYVGDAHPPGTFENVGEKFACIEVSEIFTTKLSSTASCSCLLTSVILSSLVGWVIYKVWEEKDCLKPIFPPTR